MRIDFLLTETLFSPIGALLFPKASCSLPLQLSSSLPALSTKDASPLRFETFSLEHVSIYLDWNFCHCSLHPLCSLVASFSYFSWKFLTSAKELPAQSSQLLYTPLSLWLFVCFLHLRATCFICPGPSWACRLWISLPPLGAACSPCSFSMPPTL